MSPEGYAATGGTACPACGSGQIQRGGCWREGASIMQAAACAACQAWWTNVYELTGYEALDAGQPARERPAP